jgi:hypothetical protein
MSIFVAAFFSAAMATAVSAQTVEPSYKADPDVYKVIFEDTNFRVVEVNRKAGVKDKAHSHPTGGFVYNVTDCKSKLYEADGKVRDSDSKVYTYQPVPVIASHQAENVTSTDCKQLIIEKK